MVLLYKRISFPLVLFFTVCVVSCFAQSATVSPYSRYGIGDLQNQNGVESFSMGNTGIALHNDTLTPYFINLKNPASYVYNRVTTYEAGLLNNNIWINTEGQSHFNNNTYFGYFAIAFPVSKSFGASFGLRPMSSVGYNINTTANIDSIDSKGNVTPVGTTTNQYIGTGGINQLHIGVAYSPVFLRNLSVGVNGSFDFGYLNYVENVIYSPDLLAINSETTENINVHGFTADGGVMYTIGKSRDSLWQVVLGATGSLGGSLFADYNLLAVGYAPGTPQTNIDTIANEGGAGKIALPVSGGFGITVIKRDKDNNNQWTFSFDHSIQNWSKSTIPGETESLNNSSQYNAGIQFIPHKNTTFFNRIHYRIGFAYDHTYLNINNYPVNDYCLSLGVGIPIGPPYAPPINTQLGILNIGIQVGQLGTTSNDLIREDYVKFLVAFTFNSRWFQKHLYQ
ncbi:MAG TPA: hypothetical protein VK783_15870 [Bacteroidia bacterium]|nr:hypothetical protein [Bacteroidia bacterium]